MRFSDSKPGLSIMLYFIGLGLASEKDISIAGLEVVKKAERVYLESYTAVLLVGKEELVRPLLQFS
jgi:diphthamide biosynthesis methyltransferase